MLTQIPGRNSGMLCSALLLVSCHTEHGIPPKHQQIMSKSQPGSLNFFTSFQQYNKVADKTEATLYGAQRRLFIKLAPVADYCCWGQFN